MSTFTQVLYQIVFRNKTQVNFLTNKNQEILFAYIAVVLKNKMCHPYIVGGAHNHIHIITHIHPTVAPAYIIKDIKIATHKMMNENPDLFNHFNGWQVGYGLFTYHISAKKNLINYVANQEQHHKKMNYISEFRNLLEEHNIVYKEEYLL